MKKVDAYKDGNGNVIITEDSLEMLLACLDNQKFVHEAPQNGDSLASGEVYYKGQEDIQNVIDTYNRECRKILHQKYIFETKNDGYYLIKRYEHQNELTAWSGDDVGKVYEIFKNTVRIYKKAEPSTSANTNNPTPSGYYAVESTPEPWLIERPINYDYDYLTISEDGHNNRPWKKEEIILGSR